MKFCGGCGVALRNECSRCGLENPPEFKFCGECGTALTVAREAIASAKPSSPAVETAVRVRLEQEAADAAGGERKTVTALFADIKGSMDLMEGLDPEEARSIVDPALKLMIDAMHRYDGYIVQSTGDGIFALFGAPVAHEDHAQRGLYAALRVQEDMAKYSAGLRAAGNPPVEIRVGLNTGEVVVRSIRTDDAHTEYTPIGHSMSLAARMQTLAPTGSIVITEQTQKLTAGYFDLKPLGPARIKGVTDPINVYEVLGIGPLKTRLQMSASRGLSKFVGRRAELEQLDRALELGARRTRPDRRGDGRGGSRQVAPVLRIQNAPAERMPGARGVFVLARQSVGVSAGGRSAQDLFPDRRSRRRAHAARESHRQGDCAGPRAGRNAAASVRAARNSGGRRRDRRNGSFDSPPPHARGGEESHRAREPQSAADRYLRGPSLDRRGVRSAAEPARRFDWHRANSDDGQLSARVSAQLGQQNLLHAVAARSAGRGKRGRAVGGDAGRRRRARIRSR